MYTEHGEALEVGRRAEEGEVGADAQAAAHPGAAPAVAATHQVGELPFHFGTSGAIASFPGPVPLVGTSPLEGVLVGMDPHLAPGLRGRAFRAQGA